MTTNNPANPQGGTPAALGVAAASPQLSPGPGNPPPPTRPPLPGLGAGVPAALLPKPYDPSWLVGFLLRMSKTDIQAIGHCTYEAVATQAALGAMVCLSGLLALSSSFFLVYSITEGAFGAAWLAPLLYAGAVTLFDRELVGYTPASDMKVWQKFLHLLPRLAFACVLGFAIAIPMEHKLMEKAIEEEIAFDVARSSAGIAKRSEDARAEIADDREQLKKELEGARSRLADVERRLNVEYIQRGGKGPRYAALEEERNRMHIAALQAQERFTNHRPTAAQEAAAKEADAVIPERIKEVRKDILKRTEALQRIRDRSAAADLLAWLVTFVFVLLELFPIILKLFQRYNEYHAYIEVRRRIAIQKSHVLGNHALEFIDKYPAEAARMELTDIIQTAGEDPVISALAGQATGPAPLAGQNPYVQMMRQSPKNPPPAGNP